MDRLNPARWPWPLPAIAAWFLCWALFREVAAQDAGWTLALGLACGLGVLLSLWGQTWWRRLFIAAGFPFSLALSSPVFAYLPPWGWLVPLALLLLVYPLNAWRDAPLFPTPLDALKDLPQHALLPDGARVLDAGCGLGHGLQALRQVYPNVQLHGMEFSWPLRFLCAMRCPWARIRQGDIWKADWSSYEMVYLFQRPESMERAAQKAARELQPGAWMVSLEFEATTLQATSHFTAPGGKMVWLYQAPLQAPLRAHSKGAP